LEEEEVVVVVEITVTSQSGKPVKPHKRRAIPKKDSDGVIHRKVRSELALDSKDEEFRAVWKHDPLPPDPWDMDEPIINPFLLQEDYI
jgi:hypothetical protein